MRIENSASVSLPQKHSDCIVQTEEKKTVQRQDSLTLSPALQEKQPPAPSNCYEKEIARLEEQLKEDASFVNDSCRNFINSPTGRKLASTMILSDKNLQEEIAKYMWESTARSNQMRRKNPLVYGPGLPLPKDYHGYNIRAMLLCGDEKNVDEVLFSYEGVLNHRARTCGLTDTERLMSASQARIELRAQGTFHEQMSAILDELRNGFREEGLVFDEGKDYSFYLDTSAMRLSVTGGNDQEKDLIEEILNTSNYKKDNFLKVLSALYNHRCENKMYTPWAAESAKDKPNMIPQYGVADVPPLYTKKMKALFPAYRWHQMDVSLKRGYGFGMDDIRYIGGETIVGKTDEITEIIKKGGSDFMKKIGYPYIRLCERYKGTPEFLDPVFTFKSGKFAAAY